MCGVHTDQHVRRMELIEICYKIPQSYLSVAPSCVGKSKVSFRQRGRSLRNIFPVI